MVTPLLIGPAIEALGLQDLRAALAFIQRPRDSILGGLGISRRQIARSLGVNESTLRGIERTTANPRQATVDRVISRIRDLDILVTRSGQDRTNIETLVAPDLSPLWYVPRPPPGVTAFRLVIVAGEDKAYAYETLTRRSLGSFDVTAEIIRQQQDGFKVTRVIWDKSAGVGNRIVNLPGGS